MYTYISILISELILVLEHLLGDNTVYLETNETTISGLKLHTIYEYKPYVAFWKIPYAEPPVGSLRFKPPKPKRWLKDTCYIHNKPYTETCSSSYDENCLYLSVFMPYTSLEPSFAVVVWLHEYASDHGPDFLIDENVIVVTVSYRTTILGFLNTEDDFAKGNMGAKDILEALRWIRENIVYFNGDPNRVTVIGSGVAANLVASFLISPLAEDLFARAIVQSGSALAPTDYRSYNFEILNKLYWKFYGAFEKFNRSRLYERLQNATITELISISRNLFDSTEIRDDQRLINSFGITIETTKKGAFMDESPVSKYKKNFINDGIDVIMGFNSLESLYKLEGFIDNRHLLKSMNYNFQYLLPFEGRKNEYGSRQYKQIRRQIMDFYFVNATIGERSLRRYAKYLSDQVIYPVLRQARLHSERSSNHVYLYRFAFQGCLNAVWSSTLSKLRFTGATAGDEICYQFKCKSLEHAYIGAENTAERYFVKKIARLVANFAKYGNPTPEPGSEILGGRKWEPLMSKGTLRGMNLGRNVKMVKLPETKRVEFWDHLRKQFFEDADLTELSSSKLFF